METSAKESFLKRPFAHHELKRVSGGLYNQYTLNVEWRLRLEGSLIPGIVGLESDVIGQLLGGHRD